MPIFSYMTYKPTINLTNFKASGSLGELFEKANTHNQLNKELQKLLGAKFKGLSLCLVTQDSVTLIASNSAVAYRTEKQIPALLKIVQQISELSNIKKITIKVDKKGY